MALIYALKSEYLNNDTIKNQLKSVLEMNTISDEMLRKLHGNLLQLIDDETRGNYNMVILGVVGDKYNAPTLDAVKTLISELV